MEPYQTIYHRGQKIEICYDERMDNPNDWDSDYMFLIYDHRDFAVAPYPMKPREAEDIFDEFRNGKKTYMVGNKRYWIIPVYAYIHSGVSLYLSRREANRYEHTGFDTSFKGFMMVNRNLPLYWKFEDAFEAAEKTIRVWNQHLAGEVYGYVSPCGSCWCFYGDEGIAQAIEEAKAEIDSVVDGKNKERLKRLKKYIKSKVPIEYRKLEPVV